MKISLIMCISNILTDLCCLQCFSSEKVLTEHKENCLVINGGQSVKLKSGSTSFKNCFKQLPVPLNSMLILNVF